MTAVLLAIHIIACVVLIVTILLQAGKGGGLAGSAFGGGIGGGGGAVFGGSGAGSFLAKVTTYLAIVFLLTCLALYYTSRSGDTIPQTAAERMLGKGTPVPLQSTQTPQPLTETEKPAGQGEEGK
jgi:preprotein translocase subunit SecG